jgi:lipooligosaccharide transport system ATP-binding protein
MLYGFSPPSDGSIKVFDLDITKDWRKIKARIGICQQENTLDPDLTVEQNLLIFAGYFYIPSKKAKERCRVLLQFLTISAMPFALSLYRPQRATRNPQLATLHCVRR